MTNKKEAAVWQDAYNEVFTKMFEAHFSQLLNEMGADNEKEARTVARSNAHIDAKDVADTVLSEWRKENRL